MQLKRLTHKKRSTSRIPHSRYVSPTQSPTTFSKRINSRSNEEGGRKQKKKKRTIWLACSGTSHEAEGFCPHIVFFLLFDAARKGWAWTARRLTSCDSSVLRVFLPPSVIRLSTSRSDLLHWPWNTHRSPFRVQEGVINKDQYLWKFWGLGFYLKKSYSPKISIFVFENSNWKHYQKIFWSTKASTWWNPLTLVSIYCYLASIFVELSPTELGILLLALNTV